MGQTFQSAMNPIAAAAKPPNGDRTRVLPLLRRALCRELTDVKENSVDTLDKHGYHLERFREHM